MMKSLVLPLSPPKHLSKLFFKTKFIKIKIYLWVYTNLKFKEVSAESTFEFVKTIMETLKSTFLIESN